MDKKSSKKEKAKEKAMDTQAADDINEMNEETVTNEEQQEEVNEETVTNEEQQEEVNEETREQTEEEKTADKLSEINDKYLRLSAEYDNYRRRTLKEKMELTKTAGESILLALLPVIDDFDRAMAHMDDAKDVEALKQGMKLIHTKFNDFLGQQGMKEIEAKDKEFDTDLHEAVTKIPAPAEEMKGKVIDCIEKGYTLHEKVVRFSKVVVGE
ncbi:nucleotide exchange factor GrpE [Carboxylicivirga sp. A043]|uniref:nucleotide exchange factor GrpE n=1 Tax=Carboxylicivirga litoralis TaxID=2816963 RepID=UPI0021CB84CC|nr:nucleotide exchange factor GrpE [Carboxylicivirga sp. A043]MCU4155344.1 nucleotide exchange factor GrpE [Carboxylicivirga sp. A043]